MKTPLDAIRETSIGGVFVLPSAAFAVASLLGLGVLVAASISPFAIAASSWSTGVVLIGYLCASGLCVRAIQKTYPHSAIGLCNLVTLCRLILVSLLALAALEAVAPNAAILMVAIATLCLDGADGWLARRANLSSDFGARFDVEVDAAFAMILALYAATSGSAGPFVLLLGLPHYLFGAARKLWPWLSAPLPPRFDRKAVCVLQIGTLIALLIPQFDGLLRECAVAAAVISLAWSFGRDIIWLYRTRM